MQGAVLNLTGEVIDVNGQYHDPHNESDGKHHPAEKALAYHG
jgi:hypothetical protein